MNQPTLPVADRIAIEDLLTALCRAVDERDPDRLGTLLTEDVHFDLGHHVLEGREAVIAAFGIRAADHSYVARHTWSNLSVDAVREDEAALTFVFATFAHLGSGESLKPVWRAGDSHDVVRRLSDGSWVLHRREMRVLMP